VCKVLVGKPEGKRPLGRPRRGREDGERMDLRETGGGVNWIRLARDRDRWRAIGISRWMCIDKSRSINIHMSRWIHIDPSRSVNIDISQSILIDISRLIHTDISRYTSID
jgi:hypothetical protein